MLKICMSVLWVSQKVTVFSTSQQLDPVLCLYDLSTIHKLYQIKMCNTTHLVNFTSSMKKCLVWVFSNKNNTTKWPAYWAYICGSVNLSPGIKGCFVGQNGIPVLSYQKARDILQIIKIFLQHILLKLSTVKSTRNL